MSDSCLFCRIVDGSIPSTRVYEDEAVVAFLDLHPTTTGHTLVIPRKHSAAILDTDPAVLQVLLPSIQRVARGICKALQVDGFNVHQNNGSVAGQVIPHLHFHIIPRRPDDGLHPWPDMTNPPDDREALAQRIAEAIQS